MEIKQFSGFTPIARTNGPSPLLRGVKPLVDVGAAEPQESFSSTALPSTLGAPGSNPAAENAAPAVLYPGAQASGAQGAQAAQALSWQEGTVTFQGLGNGPISSFSEAPSVPANAAQSPALTLAEMLKGLTAPPQGGSTRAMGERENAYLGRFPFKDDEKALKARAGLNVRYNDSTTSAKSMTETVSSYAEQRGLSLDKVPSSLVGELSSSNLDSVKAATQSIVDKLFLNKDVSFNPEKHATVTAETSRFLDLATQAAPAGFTAGDAYKLVAGNLALVSYQDKAASENMLGDHGVRHLLGHNIKACEQLADGLEKQGVPVSPMDRLVMHQAMIVHDLGYAMDSVRNPINAEGIKGQDAGHNVLAARYLRERAENPEDPVAKLFGSGDLERMHRCVLFHDKDVNGKPGVEFKMGGHPTEEDRAVNLETMTRVADNSHAFEDKLPELLYREPASLKTLRLMKTAGELGDNGLVDDLKGDLAAHITGNENLAKDDKEALLQSVSSLGAESYKFSVGRVAGTKPTFDITPQGKVMMDVNESDTHQQTVSLFGMQSFGQMEKFVSELAGQKVKLQGNDEIISGGDVEIRLHCGPNKCGRVDAFNTGLNAELLSDKPFVKFALLDSQLSQQQAILEEKAKLGSTAMGSLIDEVKSERRRLLEEYRGVA